MQSRIVSAVPGSLILLGLWYLTVRRLDWVPWVETNYGLWQSLGEDLLRGDALRHIAAMHIQPPGLNALLALDLLVTPENHLLLLLIYLLLAISSLVLVVDALSNVGVSRRAVCFAGVFYALLPGTVIYALWPFSTTPTMFATALTLWGVAKMHNSPALGAIASGFGAVLLWAFRSSFLWIFVAVWLVALFILLLKRVCSRRELVAGTTGLLAAAIVVLGGQWHYLTSFGLWSTSSWTGQNILSALTNSGKLEVSQAAREGIRSLGRCHEGFLAELESGRAPMWDVEGFLEIPGCGQSRMSRSSGNAALDLPLKSNAVQAPWEYWDSNFNWSQRLIASRVISQVAQEVVLGDPQQLFMMAVTGGWSGSRGSAAAIYLSPSDDFRFIAPIRLAYPNQTLGGLVSLMFAPAAWTLIILGLVIALARRDRGRLERLPLFWFGFSLILYHAAVSVLLEYGENNRFQAEMAPALVLMSALVLWAVVPAKRSNRSHLTSREIGTPRVTRASAEMRQFGLGRT